MFRIAILYTGGTIGMKPSPRGLVVSQDAMDIEERVIRLAPPDVACYFEMLSPLIDSASATPAHWDRLARRLAELREKYDGFVVLHGTDTLAWTAAALAFLLPNFGKPLVLTGSMRPFAFVGSDAMDNVADALLAATFIHLTEVTVAFGRKLWRGSQVRKIASTAFEAFATPDGAALAEFSPQLRWWAERWRVPVGEFFQRPLLPNLKIANVLLAPGFTVSVAADILERQKLDGVILQTYGAGNVPEDPRFLRAVATAAARGTMIVNVSQASEVLPTAYESASILTAAGVLSAGRMTPEAALVKLYVLLSSGETMEAQTRAWSEDWAGEQAFHSAV